MERETTSFDPRTWVDPKPVSAPVEDVPEEPAPQGRPLKPLMIAAPVALVLAAGGAYFLWPDSAGDAGSVSAPVSTATASSRAETPVDATSVRIIEVRGVDELGFSLEAMGVPTGDAFALAQEAIAALGTEDQVRIAVELADAGKDKAVRTISAELPNGSSVKLTRQRDGTFKRDTIVATATTRVRSISGTINQNTFYASAVEAGLPDSLTTPFAKAFSFDFDFQREVALGDRFQATWEESVTDSGRNVVPPRLLYVRLETDSGSKAYYAFTPPDETEQRWFDERGQGNERGLMRTPVDGARITSKYGYRTHPISQRQKKHNGVDFAAPTGTPIYASGDSTVAFAGPRGSAGNFIRLDHGEGMQTWYMHLNAFADGLVPGKAVRQGEIIGYVGTTGGSTGPHLHYEIRIEGEPLDPLTFRTSEVEALAGEALTMFTTQRDTTKAAVEKKR
ncbi:M23 family metallopeptidase [Erythrobacter sp. JK5]|uniref:M23 family metallopeptidase n=1 Tax=Erythrobacter sp. JK5 TaxID=2829500 RepID=UPI001BA980C0|nr:peptidoglycan DD-metalloendopeptidase family protein [Erythrobacter sp. JK5]QUL36787.1 peptidoglycan DD-metalloendopeptidase family protein [Erythrobacter sp. JK5]